MPRMRAGIMVLLDVVYNHFGPDGNYLAAYAPIFNDRHHTPWGAAVNYDAEGSADGARIRARRTPRSGSRNSTLDGLRLDAVHAIMDDSENHLLDEIPARLREVALGRPIHLVLENEENEVSRLCAATAASRCNTPRSGTTMCIMCCTPRRPARAPATIRNMPATPPSSAARWRKVLPFRAT